jgi:hypothetical protein
MKIGYILAVIFIATGYFLQAQVPVERTSATDGTVKVHGSGKYSSFRYDSRWRKSGRQAHSTEQQGQAVKKHKPSRSSMNEARVFKRHKHAARKGTHLRARRHGKKYSMARR